ncbi:MAG TPA: hypothetical protein EYP28_00830 [Methanophagales archaeon]|nr:hypothetical protein [Methanophagales archaeon]
MVKRVSSGNFTIEQVSRIYGIIERRVQHLTKICPDTEEIPRVKPNRRSKMHLSDDQKAFRAIDCKMRNAN